MAHGEKALFRLLSWPGGRFSFVPSRRAASATLSASTDSLLMEGMRQGDELKLPDKRPGEEEIRETEEGLCLLAGYLIQRNADRVRAARKADRAVLEFHFQH